MGKKKPLVLGIT
ncbi:hypothetical protein D039_1190A, partial [Vibrio parahaemolyticus EKP-028]